ncbi:MAG: thiamine pyrophosphate-dependent enzyme [Bacteroidia bacterium]|nr:thiamine pyrophosphate-dependent enzyme [Bacteroidia bacterium]MDW8347771.1 thiamine pyrophosphate-dependent enzyme [Bacteroidia bacterium]
MTVPRTFPTVDTELLKKAYLYMQTAKTMAEVYDANRTICKYVHSTSRGHEAVQLATAFLLQPEDWVSPYYRDDSILLGIGLTPYDLMLQLLAKRDDIFSGGRSYYCHPSLKQEDKPKIIHQSSATGMQAIPATGIAQGIQYLENIRLSGKRPIVVCSLGDGSVTEGEVAEAFQMAVLKKLPILYLIQDNGWGISASGEEMRAMNAIEYAQGFKGMATHSVKGNDFTDCYKGLSYAFDHVRKRKGPMLVHALVPLLGHHTSGVRKEWYRTEEDLKKCREKDPILILESQLLEKGVGQEELNAIKEKAKNQVLEDFERAKQAPEPDPSTVEDFIFVPTPIIEEKGNRTPLNGQEVVMVDAALHAVGEILAKHPEALLYGQDVGERLGGVFREAALLAQKFGSHRVFNTPIQEAYIIGSTVGMSQVGCKPIVEVQFADYIWPGLNQLVEEISKSCYLSMGKCPIQTLIRVPVGAYGGGGPYHSGSIESTLLTIKGIKVVYPSNAADMKGLMKAAFYDPNPVVMLEHKGLYWSKVPGTSEAKTIEPDEEYIIPLGKANIVLPADENELDAGSTIAVITYGMGVYWAKNAAKNFKGKIEIVDLRTLHPLDWDMIEYVVKKHNKVLLVTEEPIENSFIEALAGRISHRLFKYLDAPVSYVGALNLPAVPINLVLEAAMLPSADKVAQKMAELLEW